MDGSSASNEYGKGGTVNAMGLSSGVRFEIASARKRPEAAWWVPSNPAPTMPVLNKNLRRFMAMIHGPVPARQVVFGGRPDYSVTLSHLPNSGPSMRVQRAASILRTG